MLSTNKIFTIDAVLIAPAVPFGPKGQPSAIAKQPVPDRIRITETGLDGDEQGDTRHHGGPEKAIHLYPRDHYSVWQDEHSSLCSHLQAPGAFGENISARGLNEDNVCIGDIWRMGSALVQISQGRQPCWKLNVRFDRRDMAALVQNSGRTGWYYRVMEPGDIAVGDHLQLVERSLPAWPLSRLHRLLYVTMDDWGGLEEMAGLQPLAQSWRKLAATRLAKRQTEDWRPRLDTPS